MKWFSLAGLMLVGLLCPLVLSAQEVGHKCVSGCTGASGGGTHEPSAAAIRREKERDAAIERYNKAMRAAHDLYSEGQKASEQRNHLKALDLFKRAHDALASVRPVDESSRIDKEKRLVLFQEAIAYSEANNALTLRNQRDWSGALRYYQLALTDYPAGGSHRAELEAQLEKTRRMQTAQEQAQRDAERRRIEAAERRAQGARIESLLNAGKRYDEQLAAPSPDLAKPVDPGFFVTADIYQSAGRKMHELRTLETKLSAKIDELNHWRGDMLSQKREFDRLHAEAAHDELADVIAVIPSDAICSHLLKHGMTTAVSAEALRVAFERLKAAGTVLANTGDVRNERDLVQVQVTATQETIVELTRLATKLPLTSAELLWTQRTVKALKMFGETANAAIGLGDGRERTEWWERYEPAADLAENLAGIAMPTFGAGLAGVRVAERQLQKATVARAQDSLGGAIADNWNAKVYLTQKLERVRQDIGETQRTMSAYEARKARQP